MNVVDSSAWIEYFRDGPNAKIFMHPLEDVANLIVPSICIYEVLKSITRQEGSDEAIECFAIMKQGRMVDLTPELAVRAAETSLKYNLPMADSVILAITHAFNATLWTQDKDFSGLRNVKYFPKE